MKRGTTNHPKTLALAAALAVDRCVAVGILEGLFHFASQYARRGDVGRYADGALAAGCGTSIDGAVLVRALLEAGWLDACGCHRLRVHDWPEHADQGVQRSPEVKRGGFLACYSVQLENSSRKLATDGQIGWSSGGRRTEEGNGAGSREEGPPQPATAEQATAYALERIGPPPNPLVNRAERESRFYALVREIAPQVNLDPTEVARKVTEYRGGSYVRADTMPDDRLAHAVAAAEKWARQLRGQAEPELPPARAAPSPRAQGRVDVIAAGVAGGLREHERGELGQGVHGAVRGLPGPGHDA